MQDNDPKHTSKLCKNYLKTKEDQGVLTVMDFPPQSPDLNPISTISTKKIQLFIQIVKLILSFVMKK